MAEALGLIQPMCGRFTLTAAPREVADMLALLELEEFPPRYNIAPTQPILIALGGTEARPDANRPGREARLVRWGFIPSWVKELKGFPLLNNARAETAAEKNAFKAAMKYRRCLIPASGFYEWQRDAKGKPVQAYFLKPRSGRPIAFAGVMETWHAPDGSEIDTAAILTTAANQTLRPIHDRMPVVIPEGGFEMWLNCRDYAPPDVAGLMGRANEDVFEAIAVSDKVNKVANVTPDVQAPIALAARPRPGDKGGDNVAPDLDEGPAQRSLF